MKPEYLYLHVPFCARRCSYCDFAVSATREPPVEAWLSAIEAELRLIAEADGWRDPVELRTIYLGGGTPSLLGLGAISRLRHILEGFFAWDDQLEWTVEANPESFDLELARDWRETGVNRLSLGAQSFHEGALRWMGRLHGPDGPGAAVDAARRAGIENFSIDLIFGLPARLGRDWSADLDRALDLEPYHLSLYGLTAEPATPLGRWVGEGREVLADDETYGAEFLEAARRMTDAGYSHYEVSNFALPGHESRHNSAYWQGRPYLGLGPSAHSFLGSERRWNLREWEAYRKAVEAGISPVAEAESVRGEAARLEGIWLGLRSGMGIARAGWSRDQEALAERWARAGWARLEQDRLVLTADGWLLLDQLAVEFDSAAPRSMT